MANLISQQEAIKSTYIQLQKQVYELIENKGLTEKENYIFNHNNNVFSVSEHTRTLTDMQQVRDFFVKKKVDMPVKQSTYYSIKNVTNNKEQESLIEEQLGRIANA